MVMAAVNVGNYDKYHGGDVIVIVSWGMSAPLKVIDERAMV